MEALTPILQGDREPGLYRVIAEINPDFLTSQLQEQGWTLFYINGQNIRNKAEFLQECAKVMHFPSYFGYNWDAFEECITDPSIVPINKSILLYDRPEYFAQDHPSQWSIAFHILQTTVEYWKEKNTPMYILLKSNNPRFDNIQIL